jgi:hypothetical protein
VAFVPRSLAGSVVSLVVLFGKIWSSLLCLCSDSCSVPAPRPENTHGFLFAVCECYPETRSSCSLIGDGFARVLLGFRFRSLVLALAFSVGGSIHRSIFSLLHQERAPARSSVQILSAHEC